MSSTGVLYDAAKCLSLACGILWMGSASAQTPWQAAPAVPAPLNRPNPIQPPNNPSNPSASNPALASNVPTAAGGQPQTSAPVINRYAQPMQRPSFIPFAADVVPNFQAIDLPPPPSSAADNALDSPGQLNSPGQSLIDALPAFTANNATSQLSNGRSPTLGLPGPGQLLPRTATSPITLNTTSFDPNALPPFQAELSSNGGVANLPLLLNQPLPDFSGSQSGDKTSLTGFSRKQTDESMGTLTTSNFFNAKLVAVVGAERVLAGDMAAIIEPIISENSGKLKSKEQENEVRMTLIRQLLPQYTEMKALQQEFFRDIAGNVPPKELQKKQDEIMTRASRAFYDKFVPVELFRKHKVENVADLEAKLQENGLSIKLMKNHFLMQILAMQLEDKYVAETFEIAPAEILAYYNANIEKWRIPARVKWRQLTVRFDRHPDRAEAENRIKTMGNEIVLGGKPFEAVARDNSEGFTADEGGNHDWTTQGSLKSTVIDEALFSLPPRRLSQIIQDDIGLHIIEVLEREAARTQEMSEIQAEIRKKLSNDIRQVKLKEFRQKVLSRVTIWTLWPEDIPGSRPLKEAIAE